MKTVPELKFIPRQYSWVRFNYENTPANLHHYYIDVFPKDRKPRFVFMGESPQAKGHCFIYDIEKQILLGLYHTEDFIELTDDEC